MHTARALTLLLATAVAAAGASAASAPGGLHGTVMRGPTSPVCRDDVPCDAPASGFVLTFVRPGVARATRTDASGRYRITLPAGYYALRTNTGPLGRLSPARVHVRAGRSDRLDFAIDTGIR